MYDISMEGLILLFTAICAGGLVYYLGQLSIQIQYVILADGRRQARALPILVRAVLPFSSYFPGFLKGKWVERYFDHLDRKIVIAGFDGLITGHELVMVRWWLAWISFVLGILLAQKINFLVVILTFCAWMYPDIWLRDVVAKRHKAIQRGLPYVLDLLTVCVEAGLDFMSALTRIIDRRRMDALGEEMLRVFQTIKLGRTRRQALKEMRDRIHLPDLTSIVNALIQADELGVSIGSILRIQSDQLRSKRFLRAETLANLAPTKMIFPLVFIFLAALIILLGPILLQIFHRLL